MSIQRTSSGKYRAQVHVPGKGNVSVGKLLGGSSSFDTRREAKIAHAAAYKLVGVEEMEKRVWTVGRWHETWTTDPLYQRPATSTNIHNRERTRKFAKQYEKLPLKLVDDQLVAQWLAGGNHNGSVPALRAMFGDATSAKAGRLIDRNPFAKLGLKQKRGNKDRTPPSLEKAYELIAKAHEVATPHFAAYLEVACWSAMRPGEMDALRWESVDFDRDEILVKEQWNVKSREFTPPKHGNVHTITMTPNARKALLAIPKTTHSDRSPFVFLSAMGNHFTPSTRSHHWNRVRASVGLANVSLYMATRHFIATYMLNVLDLEPHVIASQLGHRDQGELVVQLYGHPSETRNRAKILDAFEQAEKVVDLASKRKAAQ